MRENAKLITVILLALLTVIVVLQNTESVRANVLFWSLTMPVAALLLGTLAVGLAVGILLGMRFRSRRRK